MLSEKLSSSYQSAECLYATCFACKQYRVELENPKVSKNKADRYVVKGECPGCGRKVQSVISAEVAERWRREHE